MARPREFDLDEAIVTATELFWRQGYDGTSLTNLEKAIGITTPSFYAAFGSKEGLFKKVLAHYQKSHNKYFGEALSAPTAKVVAETLLFGFVDSHTSSKNPPGCLALNSSLPAAGTADPVRRELLRLRKFVHAELSKRFRKAKTGGDLSEEADPEGLARYLLSLCYGMAVEAQSGASRKDLRRVAETALRVFSQFGQEAARKEIGDPGDGGKAGTLKPALGFKVGHIFEGFRTTKEKSAN